MDIKRAKSPVPVESAPKTLAKGFSPLPFDPSVRKDQRNDCSHFADGKPKAQKGCSFPASRNTGLRLVFPCGVLARDLKAPGQAWATFQLLHSSARGPKGEGWRKARTKVVYPEGCVCVCVSNWEREKIPEGCWSGGDGCGCWGMGVLVVLRKWCWGCVQVLEA